MARYFFNICPFETTKFANFAQCIKFANVALTFSVILNKPCERLESFYEIVKNSPNWVTLCAKEVERERKKECVRMEEYVL